jgi:hypothetical protein
VTAIRVAVVGPCAAGKSTLVAALRQAGYEAKHVAQEHSYVPNMWQRLTRPDHLIYLDVAPQVAINRRGYLAGAESWLAEQARRLAHAREHCHLYVDTSELTVDEVRERVLGYLARAR